MSNKTIDKRDLVMNQAMEILLDMLKEHMDDKLCNYVYFELTLGEGIDKCSIDWIKNKILKNNGSFRTKDGAQYSMMDIVEELILLLNETLRIRVLAPNSEEIIKKYGESVYRFAIWRSLKKTLFGIKERYFNRHYNNYEEMIEEYILRA